ncbi:hypothetical protein C1S79_15480 [Mycolicibacterium phocaicum]|uniref:Uncharacterized protein n=1 Tax=Mycolicibacterium phocaicum TaxID=319706 RepID=A0AA94UDU0_9MYCO|nr:hypothetical protein C1S79_15480 [Mycolicibacterium phocaicum]
MAHGDPTDLQGSMGIGHLEHDTSRCHHGTTMFAHHPRVLKFLAKVFIMAGKRERHTGRHWIASRSRTILLGGYVAQRSQGTSIRLQ